jgi:hypothetical protein
MSVSLTGSFLEKMQEALRFSEKNRRRAVKVREDIRAVVANELHRRHAYVDMPVSNAQLDTIVDARVAADSRFSVAVANEGWGRDLAQTYALVELVAAQNETNALLRELLQRLDTRPAE